MQLPKYANLEYNTYISYFMVLSTLYGQYSKKYFKNGVYFDPIDKQI